MLEMQCAKEIKHTSSLVDGTSCRLLLHAAHFSVCAAALVFLPKGETPWRLQTATPTYVLQGAPRLCKITRMYEEFNKPPICVIDRVQYGHVVAKLWTASWGCLNMRCSESKHSFQYIFHHLSIYISSGKKRPEIDG